MIFSRFTISFCFVISVLSFGAMASADEEKHHGQKTFSKGPVTFSLAFESTSEGTYLVAKAKDKTVLSPQNLTVNLQRLGNKNRTVNWIETPGGLRSQQPVPEPHSFVVDIILLHQREHTQWQWEKYEGRTQIESRIASDAGVQTAKAAAGSIEKTLEVYGRIALVPQNSARIMPRFAGQIKRLNYVVGDTVKAGAELATIESNTSLQTYTVPSPIAGTVIKRPASEGQMSGQSPLYTIIDTTTVWAKLTVFPAQRKQLKAGMPVIIRHADQELEGTIETLMPSPDQQAHSIAIVVLDNANNQLSPGDLIEGTILLHTVQAKVRVPNQAIQQFRNGPAVFINADDAYQAVPVTPGASNSFYTQILSGLEPGENYVVRNSYLIKADIEKSGASHSH